MIERISGDVDPDAVDAYRRQGPEMKRVEKDQSAPEQIQKLEQDGIPRQSLRRDEEIGGQDHGRARPARDLDQHGPASYQKRELCESCGPVR